MNVQRLWSVSAGATSTRIGSGLQDTGWPWSSSDADRALAAARARLAATKRRYRRRKAICDGQYYEDSQRPEEIIASATMPNAVVTRNHYGSLVLNASRAMFIDVDLAPLSRVSRLLESLRGRRPGNWQRMLDDLYTVLQGERDEGFRIYRTAAGFRILATSREFEPGSAQSERLMEAVSADATFIHFCRTQQSFRARLTPKPWRCDMPKPPNKHPRELNSDQQRFGDWLADYERACREHGTCQYLGHVGREEIHESVAPVVELHDRETKAFEALPLA